MSQPTERPDASGHMSITVTLDGPPRPVAPRVWGALAGALGAVCLVAGWLAVVPGFIVLFLLVFVWFFVGTLSGADGSAEASGAWSWVLGVWSSFGTPALWAVGIGLVVLKLGILLIRGRRRLVLFLRRFGDSEATHAVTVATRCIGRSWRLVTLDDARIASVGADDQSGPATAPPGRVGRGPRRPSIRPVMTSMAGSCRVVPATLRSH